MQTSVEDLKPAILGMIADSGFRDIVTRSAGQNVKQVSTLQVVGATNSATYGVVVNGVPQDINSDVDATIQEIYDALIAAIQANQYITDDVDVTGNGTDTITFTAKTAGVPFDIAKNDPGTDLTLDTPTPNVTGAPIPFGRGLAQDAANAEKVSLPGATGFQFAGVAAHRHKAMPNVDGQAKYEATEAISVLRRGRIWVHTEQAVGPTDPVYLRHTANGAEEPGQFRMDDDTSRADQITNVRWLSKTTGAGLALLDINVP